MHSNRQIILDSLDVDEYLKHIRSQVRRTNLTPLIPTLNGYQQNRCFYCGEKLYNIHVDHFIPWQALKHNEVWNLVLAHKQCNDSKDDNLPPSHFIDNLIARNEYFIASAHPIKDTLIRQSGNTPTQRRLKIINEYQYAKSKIGRIWGGNDKYDPREDKFYREWVRYLEIMYNKAIRDKIPEIIRNKGNECEFKKVSDDEFLIALEKKIYEELPNIKDQDL